MDLKTIRDSEKRQRRENFLSLVKKLLLGNMALVLIGALSFGLLFVVMLAM